MTRFAKHRRVHFVEEPQFHEDSQDYMFVRPNGGVTVLTPHLRGGSSEAVVQASTAKLLETYLAKKLTPEYDFWYYTPMALTFTRQFTPRVVVYDCMDELTGFDGAHPELGILEQELFERADVVFTGGESLYQAKKHHHANIYAAPSSIDKDHFITARSMPPDPEDQQHVPYPRFGFYGVLDERFDSTLIAQIARRRPDWQFILVGPVVKIDPASLPHAPNIHYPGSKQYAELPRYLGNWDVAIMPFALNRATKFISPTKTPEFLAGGKPVISTPITDVVTPYGSQGLIHIAGTPDEFIACGAKALLQANDELWLERVDRFLKGTSWDETWNCMNKLIKATTSTRSISA